MLRSFVPVSLINITENNIRNRGYSALFPIRGKFSNPRYKFVSLQMLIHEFANPANSFSASFSSLQNSANNSLAGVGG